MRDSDTLSPPPVNFKREYFKAEGVCYRIDYSPQGFSLHQKSEYGVFYHAHEIKGWKEFDVQQFKAGCGGCLLLMASSIFVFMMLFLVIRKIWGMI